MSILRVFGLVLLVGGLTACASNKVRQDFAFGNDPDEALLVIRKLPDAMESRINVRKVDLDAEMFAPGAAKAVYLGRGMTQRDQTMLILGGPLLAAMAPSPGNVLDDNFFLLTVPAGDYAIVSHVTDEFTEPPSALQKSQRVITTHCYTEGAPVYRLNGGEISLINLNSAKSELLAQLLENAPEDAGTIEELKDSAKDLTIQAPDDLLRSILLDFPNIKGDVHIARNIAAITFDGEQSFLKGSDCPKGMSINSIEFSGSESEQHNDIEE